MARLLAAAALAVAGVAYALRRGKPAVPLALVAGSSGAILISSATAIYFDAKTYAVLAPALGMATVAGLVWLWRRSVRTQGAAALLGVALAAGVLGSAGYVYTGVWLSPEERFEEMADIADRFQGQDPVLVNGREYYAKYFLRDLKPWSSYDEWQPARGLRAGPVPPAVPHPPDFDDYTAEHMARFQLLVERRRPGGSAPPAAFEPVYETPHYRVWRRTGPPRRRTSRSARVPPRAQSGCAAATPTAGP